MRFLSEENKRLLRSARYTAIQISLSLRDKEERLYVGTATIDKANRDWANIPLEEKAGE